MFTGDMEDAGLPEVEFFTSFGVYDGDVGAGDDSAYCIWMIGGANGNGDGTETFADAVAVTHFDGGAVPSEVFDNFFGGLLLETFTAGDAHFDT